MTPADPDADPVAPRPLEIGLMFTHRCPIECRHCGILSGPDNHQTMADGLAERCIDEAAALDPRPVTIVFTGGEPMMYPDRLERLLERCYGHGLSTRVVTSGFWARNKASGRRLLYRMRLAGLDALNFSADKFHLEFLEPSVLRAAIDLAWEVGLPVIVNMVVTQTCDPVAEFSKLYDIAPDRIQLFNEEQVRLEFLRGRLPDGWMTKVNLSAGRLVGLGRAAQYPDELSLSAVTDFAVSPCDEVVNRPVIYPDGSLQACCCAGGKLATFYVGNVRTQSLADLFEVMRGRDHFRFINRFGPRALYQALEEMTPADANPSRGFASICDVCVAATCGRAPDQVDRLLDHWGLKQFLAQATGPLDSARATILTHPQQRETGHG
jgi:MoaA/NifB/PqqE/SkfB family radical SAM enzyme